MRQILKILLFITMLAPTLGFSQTDFETTKSLAEQGDALAQIDLGLMYADGEGVPQNYAEAVKWWRLAAEQGDASAQHNLGIMYANGRGVPQNGVMAYVWESLAAAQGHEDARFNRDISANQFTPEQLARGQDIAARCFESGYKDCN